MSIENYNQLDSGEIYLSSLGDYGRNTKTILMNFIDEASKKADHISLIYRDILEAMLLKFGGLTYSNSEDSNVGVKVFHANPERAIAKLNQDNNIILPAMTISNSGSDTDTNRMRYKGNLIYKTIVNAKTNKIYRVVSIAPRPVNISYEINIWSKYISDLDQLTEQIRREFNPHIDIATKYNEYNKVFLQEQTNTSEFNVGDGSDRIIRRVFNVTVETYIPYPEYLLTSNGKIQLFTTELYNIISDPITSPVDFSAHIISPDAGIRPPSSGGGTVSGIGGTTNVLAIYNIEPEFGPWYVSRSFAIYGEGFNANTQVYVAGIQSLNVVYYNPTILFVSIPAFTEDQAGGFLPVEVLNPGTGDTSILENLFQISPIPTLTGASYTLLDNGLFESSSIVLTVSGTEYDTYLQPYYGFSQHTTISVDGVELDTEVLSETSASASFYLTDDNKNTSATIEIDNYNGSAILVDAILLPDIPVPVEDTVAIASTSPEWAPSGLALTLNVSGTGFLDVSAMSAKLNGVPYTILSAPTGNTLSITVPAFQASDVGENFDLELTVSGSVSTQVVTYFDAIIVSEEPYTAVSGTVTPNYTGADVTSLSLEITAANLTYHTVPYYSSALNVVVTASSYAPTVGVTEITYTDTSLSATILVTEAMSSIDFDLTVSNINGSSTQTNVISVPPITSKSSPLSYVSSNVITSPLIQAIVPITPVSSLPPLWIDGSRADVFPVSYDAAGKADVVQAIGIASGTGTGIITSTGSDPLPSSNTYNTLEISGMGFEMDVSNKASNMTANPFTTSIEVLRSGYRVREDVYHDLIKDASLATTDKHYSCANVKTFVTRRSDTSGLDIWVLVSNDTLDINNDVRRGIDYHPEVAGQVWFKSMQLTNIPTGYRLYSEFDDKSMDTANGYVVAPVSNGAGGVYEQLFPACQRLMRHYILGPDTVDGASEAAYLFTMGDVCEVRSGDFSYYETSGYGAQRDYLPPITDDFQLVYNPNITGTLGLSGLDIMDYRCERTLSSVQYAYENDVRAKTFKVTREWGLNIGGSIGLTTDNMVSGYYQPYGDPNPRTVGGYLIHTRHGWQNNRKLWKLSALQLMYQVQRHDSSITKIDGGILYATEFAEANPESTTTTKYSPWSFGLGMDQPQYWFPWFSYESSNPNQHRYMAPSSSDGPEPEYNRDWFTPEASSNSLYFTTDTYTVMVKGAPVTVYVSSNSIEAIKNFQKSGPTSHFGAYEGDHHARFDQTLQPLVWSCNLGIAKWVLKQEAAHLEHTFNRYEIRNSVYSGGGNGPNDFQSKAFSLNKTLSDINDSGKYQWGRQATVGDIYGGTSPTQLFPSMQRGWGHSLNIIAEGMRIEGNSSRRAELLAWAISFTTLYQVFASNVGTIGHRGSEVTNLSTVPGSDPEVKVPHFGEYDFANASGTPSGVGVLEADQTYMTAFASHGILGVMTAAFGLSNQTTNGIFRRTLEVLPYYLWKYADTIGNNYAQNFIIHSVSGTDSNPPSTIKGWDFKSGEIYSGYGAEVEMKCCNLLYTGYLLTRNIKFLEWFYKLLFQPAIKPYSGMANLPDSIREILVLPDVNSVDYGAAAAIKLFNQIAGQNASGNSFGWEVERPWANHAAQFIGLINNLDKYPPLTLEDSAIPASYYDVTPQPSQL